MIVRAGNGKLGLSGSQGMSNLVYARMLASWSCCQYESLTVLTQNAGQAGNMRYLWPARGEDIVTQMQFLSPVSMSLCSLLFNGDRMHPLRRGEKHDPHG